MPDTGENPLSQKYFGENFDELKTAFDELKASLAGLQTVFDALVNEAFVVSETVAGMYNGSNAQALITPAQKEEIEAIPGYPVSRHPDFPDVSSIEQNPVHITNVHIDRLIASQGWLGRVRDQIEFLDVGDKAAKFEALKEELNKVRRWRLHGGKK